MNKLLFGKGFMVGYAAGLVGGFVIGSKKRWLRRKMWEMRARGEIGRRLNNVKKFTRSAYGEIVDSVIEKYRAAGTIAATELTKLSDDLKDSWQEAKERFEAAEQELEEDLKDNEAEDEDDEEE